MVFSYGIEKDEGKFRPISNESEPKKIEVED